MMKASILFVCVGLCVLLLASLGLWMFLAGGVDAVAESTA
jgi:hypothetical protein